MLDLQVLTQLLVGVAAAATLFVLIVTVESIRRVRQLRKSADSISRRVELNGLLVDRLESDGTDDLDSKVKMVASLSTLLAQLNEEVKAEFTLQIAEVERLKQEATNAMEIAALNERAMKAAETLVAGQMDLALRRNSRGERAFQILLAGGGALVGIAATLVIQAITAAA